MAITRDLTSEQVTMLTDLEYINNLMSVIRELSDLGVKDRNFVGFYAEKIEPLTYLVDDLSKRAQVQVKALNF